MSNVIKSGSELKAGGSIQSKDGRFKLEMQKDGNLVVYGPGHKALWATASDGHPGAIVRMQGDGNLCVIAPGNKPVWASGSHGNPGSEAIIQDDGNFVIIKPGNQPVWASGTNESDQDDGDEGDEGDEGDGGGDVGMSDWCCEVFGDNRLITRKDIQATGRADANKQGTQLMWKYGGSGFSIRAGYCNVDE